ncbi:hypothetical protein AFLA_004659 [Aspergillus flavus NRRL3357]|nr:hypothetical protein AFLA_004659 [Aspergillus flavus NRRL3357]
MTQHNSPQLLAYLILYIGHSFRPFLIHRAWNLHTNIVILSFGGDSGSGTSPLSFSSPQHQRHIAKAWKAIEPQRPHLDRC